MHMPLPFSRTRCRFRFVPAVLPLVVFALFALLVLPGCPPPASSSSPDAANGKVLRCDLAADPEKLDPATMTGVPEGRVVFNVFEGLFMPTHDGNPSPDLGLPVVYGAAESHTVSDDGLTWTIRLRKNGKWHNGDPVTAGDFIFAWRRVLEMNTDYAEMLDRVKNAAAFRDKENTSVTKFSDVGLKQVDDHTLAIELEAPCLYLPELLAFYVWFPVNQKVVEAHGEDWTRVEHYVGNGPFRLTKFAQKQEIVLEKFADWHDAASVKLDKVVLSIIEDATQRENQFKLGQLDMVLGSIANTSIDAWRGKPEFDIDPYFGTYYYRFNTTDGPLKDTRVRHALSLAVDRESLCRTVLKRMYPPATGFVPPIAGYQTPDMMKTDVEEARRLLAEAGYPEGEGFPTIRLLFNTDQNHQAVAVEIQQQWKTQLGIDVELENAEWKNYLDRVDKMAYQVARAGWIGDWTEPDTFLDIFQTGAGNNDTGWGNAEYDSLLAKARRETDRAKRMQLFADAEKILLADLPIMPIYHYANPRLVGPRVANYKPHPRGVVLFRYMDVK